MQKEKYRFLSAEPDYIDFTEAQQENTYRVELEKLAEEKGAEYLHERLREVDPASAESIHANNVKRVIRALEFYHQNGTPISEHNEEQKKQVSPYNLAYFVLNAPREILYERIDRRVDQMLEEGLVKEVEELKREGCHRGMVSMQGLGYKEILGRRISAGRSSAHSETRHQTFCEAAAYLVPKRV